MLDQDSREALRLAAMAANYQLAEGWDRYPHAITVVGRDGNAFLWNPLDVDGDALTLAVCLRINLHFGELSCHAKSGVFEAAEHYLPGYPADLSIKTLATRRAVVAVAAGIGRAK